MAHASWMLLLASGVSALMACSALPEYAAPKSRLPEYAAPKGRVVDPTSLDMSDVISYRSLVRADFKGKQPPPEFAPYAEKIGAATCAHILTTPDTQVRIQPSRSAAGEITYRGMLYHLGFFAQMDRNCSWWNPTDLGLPKAYILEHEQIHFALFELEARRLNASTPQLTAQLHASTNSAEAAVQLAQQLLEREIKTGLESVLARSRKFDEDTSMGHNPQQQKRWWNLVHSELALASE